MAEPPTIDDFVEGLDYPMFVVTTAAARNGGARTRAGCLVGFATQCSIDPARFLVCISVANHTFSVARDADFLALHLLESDQRDLAELFGVVTEDHGDKFGRVSWREGPHGVPLLTACPRWMVAKVLDRLDLGDHTGFVVEPVVVSDPNPLVPLTFSDVRDLDAGHPA